MHEPRRIRIDLAYDGTDFAGWQIQPEARTVQGVVTSTLALLEGNDARITVRGAGRTDAGVHARAQVCDAWIATRLSDRALLHAFASMLPADVRPVALSTVEPDFHSQHDALSKTYRYWLDRSAMGDPFSARYALHHPAQLDHDALAAALALLPGRRDWSAFTGAACTVDDRVRTLGEASYEEPRRGVGVFTFTADGFLTHMVRNLVGTLLDVARGRIVPARIAEILLAQDRRLAGATAPAHGLVLERVRYPDES